MLKEENTTKDTIDIWPDIAEANAITNAIRKRRSIYADEFNGRKVSEAMLKEILVNATWAPTHKMTEPWRFIVFQGDYLKDFGLYMAEYYKEYYKSKLSPEDFTAKYNYLKEYPLKASCMIGIVAVHNPKIGLPEWEEIAAVACAVQNMALTCTANHLGGYWSTTEAAIEYVKQHGLKANERSLGIFYVGYSTESFPQSDSKKRRSPIEKKVIILK